MGIPVSALSTGTPSFFILLLSHPVAQRSRGDVSLPALQSGDVVRPGCWLTSVGAEHGRLVELISLRLRRVIHAGLARMRKRY